jgi:hypothetical protein
MEFPMEFPPEILEIIRQYYQPCFKYFREYKRILRLCKLRVWPPLRDALQTKPRVLIALRRYEKTQIAWLKMCKKYPQLEMRQKQYAVLNNRALMYGELLKQIEN